MISDLLKKTAQKNTKENHIIFSKSILLTGKLIHHISKEDTQTFFCLELK